MSIGVVPITPDNTGLYAALAVKDHQSKVISPNAAWIAQCADWPYAATYGLTQDDAPIGLFTLIDPRHLPEEADPDDYHAGCGYLFRFMLDAKAQGKGLGRASFAAISDVLRDMGFSGMTFTTMDRTAGNALGFYEHLGAQPTGRRLEEELELKVLWSAP